MKVSDSSRAALSEQDLHAAREVLARHPIIAASSSASAMEQVLAEMHRRWGSDRFQLRCGIREPRNDREANEAAFLRGEITQEVLERRLRDYASRPIDKEMLQAFFAEMEELLRKYTRFMQAVLDLVFSPHYQDPSEEDEAAIDELATAMTWDKSVLFTDELSTVMEFLAESRFERRLGQVRLKSYGASTASKLIWDVTGKAQQHWQSCRNIACRSQTEPEYEYSAAASKLFEKRCAELPLPNDLMVLLEEEQTLARVYLRERTPDDLAAILRDELIEEPTMPNSKSTNTIWHLISDLTSIESSKRLAREFRQKVTGPAERGTKDHHYTIQACNAQQEALSLLEKLNGRPGVDYARMLCESEFGEFRSEQMKQLRGTLCVQARIDPKTVDAMSPLDFVDAYSEKIMGISPTDQIEEKKPQLCVKRWSELAIGIDEETKYWAVTPPLVPGQLFQKI